MTSINNKGTPSVPSYSHPSTNSETSPTGANGGGGFNLSELFMPPVGAPNGGSGHGGGLNIGGLGGGQGGNELQVLVGLLEDLVKMLGGNTPSGGSGTPSGGSSGTGGTGGTTGGPVGVNDASGTSGAGGTTGGGGTSAGGTTGGGGTSAGGTSGSTPSGASGTSGSAGGGSPAQQMQQWQQKYMQDWANPATRGQAAQDWQNYLQAAQAWQAAGAGAGAAGGAANGGSGNGATSLSGGSGGSGGGSGSTGAGGGNTGGSGGATTGGTGGSGGATIGGNTGGSGGSTTGGGSGSGSGGGGSVSNKTGVIHNPTSSSYSKAEVAAACKNGAPGFPSPSQWSSFDAMWDKASKAMPNTAQQNQWIHDAIVKEAGVSGVDPRIILATIMQESGGSVHVPTTNNGVRNPGLMQSHDGVAFDPANPQQSIFQMIKDGVEGTYDDSKNPGAGLAQCIQATGNPYAGMRLYNSGTVDMADLNNAEGATGAYVTEMAAKLTGNPGGG